MKIKCLKKCLTSNPEKKWIIGEVAEVSDETGNKLIKNKYFAKADSQKEDTEPELKTNGKHREKRSSGSGN